MYRYFLFLAFLALPFVLIGFHNQLDDRKKTRRRFWWSFLGTWGFLVVIRLLIEHISINLDGSEEAVQAIHDFGAAKMSLALYFGWLPAFLINEVALAAITLYVKIKSKPGHAS
jgi:hypothetical protein